MQLLSLVVPCYNEEEAVPIFYREALKAAEPLKDALEIEFCFVDDGSKDGTLKSIKNYVKPMTGFILCHFPEILEKRPGYMRD